MQKVAVGMTIEEKSYQYTTSTQSKVTMHIHSYSQVWATLHIYSYYLKRGLWERFKSLKGT